MLTRSLSMIGAEKFTLTQKRSTIKNIKNTELKDFSILWKLHIGPKIVLGYFLDLSLGIVLGYFSATTSLFQARNAATSIRRKGSLSEMSKCYLFCC